jgi:ribosomal protein S27AE
MAVWKLKSCPRCGGDLFIQREVDGWYEECLLCGYQRDVSDLVAATTGSHARVKDQLETTRGLYTNVEPSVN